MRVFLFILILLFSSSVFGKTVQIRGFNLEIDDGWEYEETVVGAKVFIVDSKDEIQFSPFLMPDGTTTDEAIKESEKHLHYKIGIFVVTDVASKFDQYTGRYEKSWLTYSKNVVMLVKYSSFNEINNEHISSVRKMLNNINWAKPQQSNPSRQ